MLIIQFLFKNRVSYELQASAITINSDLRGQIQELIRFYGDVNRIIPTELQDYQQQSTQQIGILQNCTYNNFDSQQAFKELSRGSETIQTLDLKKFVDKIGAVIDEKKQGEDKARQDEMKKKVIRVGLFRLQEFIKKHASPIVFFYEFDADQNGSISKTEFSRMLVATDIRQFSSKDIRKMVVDDIFKYYPKGEITVKQLAAFFKIKYETHMPNRSPTMGMNYDGLVNDILPKKPISKNHSMEMPSHQSIKEVQSHTFGKKQKPAFLEPGYKPKEQMKPQMKKEDSFKGDLHISEIGNIYPLSMRYYSQGEPEPSEYQVLEELEDLLRRNIKYQDKQNPKIHKDKNGHYIGSYVAAGDIFTRQFYIFQMAASVLMRQKSRIGVAQQIEPKDIIQGSVGDCYFLSSIASIISIYPELIAEKFLLNINPSNFYAVKLFIDGEWKVITTDDRFPCQHGKYPIFAKPHHNEIWVMLLEKCWAKVFGSFETIEAGSSKEGFIALAGAPCQVFSLQKQEEAAIAVKQIEIAHKHRYVSTMSGSNYLEKLGKKGEEQLGLVSGHAYSLLKLININGQVLVKIRNPWGKTIWKGDWSFDSKKWTTALRDKYNYHKNPNDGSFYMGWKDFRTYFGQIIICKLNPTFMHDSVRVKSNRHKSVYFSMKVTTPGQYILSIYQQNKRKMLTQYTNYIYSEARIIVMKKEGNSLKFIGSRSTSKAHVCSADLQLQEGEYIISAKVVWKFWESNQFVLTSYGTDHASIVTVNRAIAPIFKEQMIKSYSSIYQGTGKVKTYQKYGFNATCETNFSLETGIGFVKMTNKSDKGFQSVQVYESNGLKVIKPQKFPLEFKMAANSQKTYGFFVTPSGFEYSSTEKIKF